MANVDRRWIAPAVIAAAFAASALAFSELPARVVPRIAVLLPFHVPDGGETGPRWMTAFLLPSVALILWLGFRFAATRRAEHIGRWFDRGAPPEAASGATFERFAKTYETIVLGVVSLVLGLHAGFLAAAFDRPTMAARIVGVTFALFLIVVGNVMPRLRANWVAGIRTKRTLADPDLWRTTHRAFGAAFVAGGVATLVTALVAPAYSLAIALAAIIVACVVAGVVSSGGRGAASATLAAGIAMGLGPATSEAMVAASPPVVAVERTIK